jgi:hypothetical protein
MARVEVMLIAVLLAIALLIGILFGGGSIWLLKPEGGGTGGTTEKIVNKYVCSDGSVKDQQGQCPVITTTSDGKTSVVCPPCTGTTSSSPDGCSPFRKCDCVQCFASCGGSGGPTTTLAPPTCYPCSADTDCGAERNSELRCKNDEVYVMHYKPICDLQNSTVGGTEKCCKTSESYNKVQTCSDTQRCRKGQGCVAYEDSTE